MAAEREFSDIRVGLSKPENPGGLVAATHRRRFPLRKLLVAQASRLDEQRATKRCFQQRKKSLRRLRSRFRVLRLPIAGIFHFGDLESRHSKTIRLPVACASDNPPAEREERLVSTVAGGKMRCQNTSRFEWPLEFERRLGNPT